MGVSCHKELSGSLSACLQRSRDHPQTQHPQILNTSAQKWEKHLTPLVRNSALTLPGWVTLGKSSSCLSFSVPICKMGIERPTSQDLCEKMCVKRLANWRVSSSSRPTAQQTPRRTSFPTHPQAPASPAPLPAEESPPHLRRAGGCDGTSFHQGAPLPSTSALLPCFQ